MTKETEESGYMPYDEYLALIHKYVASCTKNLMSQLGGKVKIDPEIAKLRAELESRYKEVLEDAIWLSARNALLHKHACKAISDGTLLKELRANGAGMHLQLEGGFAQIVADAFLEQFKTSGAKNVIELSFSASDLGEDESLVVTVQRSSGKTMGTLLREANEKIDALEKQLEDNDD